MNENPPCRNWSVVPKFGFELFWGDYELFYWSVINCLTISKFMDHEGFAFSKCFISCLLINTSKIIMKGSRVKIEDNQENENNYF